MWGRVYLLHFFIIVNPTDTTLLRQQGVLTSIDSKKLFQSITSLSLLSFL